MGFTRSDARVAGVGRARRVALALATAAWLALAAAGGLAAAEVPGAPKAEAAARPVVLAYWARWGDNPSLLADFRRHADEMTIFSPLWHSLATDGSLRSRDWDRARLTREAHAAGALVVPLVTNAGTNDAIVTNAQSRARGVAALASLVRQAGYDGVDIDFEFLAPSARAGLTAFVRDLSARLHAMGKIVIVSVAAKSSFDESVNDFAIAYDYAALGRYADYVQVMAYDQHGGWSGPGPVAGLPWVERVVQVATAQIPARKVLLGVAGYGYDWGGGATRGVTAAGALALAARYGAAVIWDDVQQAPHFRYFTASGVRHEVWWENSWSVAFKTRLAAQRGLGGVALWALGQEDERMWTVLDRYSGR